MEHGDNHGGGSFNPGYRSAYNELPPNVSPVPAPAALTTYQHWDMPDTTGTITVNVPNSRPADQWLMTRFPDFDTNPPPRPFWRSLTWPLVGQGTGTVEFDTPDAGVGAVSTASHWLWSQGSTSIRAYPTFLPRPDGSPGSPFPALSLPGGQTFLAADADGDGIADAGLRHIPGGDAGGISYYVGFRIIDNNSAINVNTAWDSYFDYGPSAAGATTYQTGSLLTATDVSPQFLATGTELSPMPGDFIAPISGCWRY